MNDEPFHSRYRRAPPHVWDQVREDYLAGYSASECSRRHGVGVSNIRRRATEQGWRKADQPWTSPPALEPDDEGAALAAEVDGDLDQIALTELAWVAIRRMMRAVLKGDAAEALRWRRVRMAMEAEDEELNRKLYLFRRDAPEASAAARELVDLVNLDELDGVFPARDAGAKTA